ncbi:ECF transporter, substrate-specific component [Candidatus Nanopelagicaceae bacterium]
MKILRPVLIAALILSTLLGFLWPFFVSSPQLAQKASWFFVATTTISVLLMVALVANDDLGSKNVAFLGILSALIAALRPLGIGAIGIEPMWFALILAARAIGPTFGFLLGALSMLLSALLTGGIGPWLGYQVFAAALIGFGVGVIPSRVRGRMEIALLAIYGAISAEIFGIAMDLQFWPWSLGSGTELSYRAGAPLRENFSHFISYHYLSALAWDIPRATITVILILVAGKSALNALRRARHRAAFLTEIQFKELTDVRLNHR